MKKALRILWRIVLTGILFLVPLLLMVVLIHHAIAIFAKILAPIASHLPFPPSFGFEKPELAAIAVLLLIVLIAGLIAQTAWAAALSAKLEQLILSKMPGYSIFKSIAEDADGTSKESMKVVLARIDDAWLLAFLIETHDNGMLTVFVPSAPTPAAGSLYFLAESQIHRVDIPVSAAVKCIKRLGVGSRELLKGKFPPSVETPETVQS